MKSSSNKKSAFTLVELLVSMTIIALMAAMSISAYPKFSEQVTLTGETYKMLAYFKETQTYGVSAISRPGVKFVYSFVIDKQAGTLKRAKIESPTDTTNQYYSSTATIDADSPNFTIRDGYEISELDGISNNATTSLDKVYGFFKRPNPESRIFGLVGQNIEPDTNSGSFNKLIIVLRSKKNNAFMKKVVILQTGQMYVDDW